MKVIKYEISIFMKGIKKPIYTVDVSSEDDIDQFYEELCDDKPVMEFGSCYFAKDNFNYAKVKEKKVEE